MAISGSRILSVFLFLCVVLLTKDYWLPSAHLPSNLQSDRKASATNQHHESSNQDQEKLGSLHNVFAPTITTTTATVTVTESSVATPTTANDDGCSSAPNAQRVMVIMKTGATELEYKLPTHLITLLKCIPQGHFIAFSDMAQTFADYPIFDALQNVSAPWKEKHEDFAHYRQIEQYRAEGGDLNKLKGDRSWNLDKWKFLPMMHATYEMSPEYIDWFVYIEADTSLSWLNLLYWLKTMDPKQKYYLGSQNVIGDTSFAHGGSGFVVSRAAARAMEEVRSKNPARYTEKWEEITAASCCGDEVVARALLDAGVSLTAAWPVIQGEKISTVDFTKNHWCTPPVSMHHVSPVEVDVIWRFQTAWVAEHGWNVPYLWRDIYSHFVARHISPKRASWNNICKDRKLVSSDVTPTEDERASDGFRDFVGLTEHERKATQSFEDCANMCKMHDERCLQWQYEPGRCYLGYDIRLGATDDRTDGQWKAGWNEERIRQFIEKQEPCDITWAAPW
ncbi:hypothetical protein MBLNU457_7505t1 [Dothideomycetes sp. NU457]